LKKSLIGLAFADFVLLVFAYYVLQDLDWRGWYATLRGLSPSTSYSFLTRMFTMTGQGSALQSPPTLDWIQVVVALLIIINIVYGVGALKGARGPKEPSGAVPVAKVTDG
jgi:hypothetical protein